MAKRYNRILLAVDFHEDNQVVVDTARDLAALHDAEIHVVHVNEPLGMSYAAADGVGWSDQVYALETSLRNESRKKMNELQRELGISEERCHMLEGRPATCIHELCESENIDLIILGTHGQSGLQLLLGSTANAVLHGATCDVLAVRIRES